MIFLLYTGCVYKGFSREGGSDSIILSNVRRVKRVLLHVFGKRGVCCLGKVYTPPPLMSIPVPKPCFYVNAHFTSPGQGGKSDQKGNRAPRYISYTGSRIYLYFSYTEIDILLKMERQPELSPPRGKECFIYIKSWIFHFVFSLFKWIWARYMGREGTDFLTLA